MNGKRKKSAISVKRGGKKALVAVVQRPRRRRARIVRTTLANFVAKRKRVHFTGTYTFNLNQATGLASNSQIFRTNSLQDPDVSNVSKNVPINGYSLASQYYQSYRVRGCKTKVTVSNLATVCTLVAVTTTDQNSFASSLRTSDISTRPHAQSVLLNPIGSPGSSHTFYVNSNMPSVLGITKKLFDGDITYTTAISAPPLFPVYTSVSLSTVPEANLVAGAIAVVYSFDMDTDLLNPVETINDS